MRTRSPGTRTARSARSARTGLCLAALLGLAACDPLLGPRFPLSFVTIEAGSHHSCGIAPGGRVFCWGAGDLGQLGDGEMTTSGWPVRAGGPGEFIELALGEMHSCGLTEDGMLRCWGWNRFGQLGTGTNNDLGFPTQAWHGEHLYSRVTAGLNHTCALTTIGEAYCWGHNALGQLGDGTHQDSPLPLRVGAEEDLRFMDIAAGGMHTCALTTDGEAYCWGLNFLGQLGTGDRFNALTPTPVTGGGTYTRVTAGVSHTCALRGDGVAHCWGSNTFGELGNRSITSDFQAGSVQPVPVFQAVSGGISLTRISAGRHVTCAIDQARRGFCWGSGLDGQLGINELLNWSLPRLVVARRDMDFTHVSVGSGRHVCASTTSLAGYCWGASDSGGLGPTTAFSAGPVRVAPARNP